MAASGRTLQTAFLDNISTRQVPVSVFLLNGVRLQGVVISHDDFTLQIVYQGQAQSIYKHAIASISPSQPIDLRE
jgi:host factor-I protein